MLIWVFILPVVCGMEKQRQNSAISISPFYYINILNKKRNAKKDHQGFSSLRVNVDNFRYVAV